MSSYEVKENIITLLENIIQRSKTIESQKGSKSLLEIDLAMEEIRLLYREMDRLRKFTEAESLASPLRMREENMSYQRKENPLQKQESLPEEIVSPVKGKAPAEEKSESGSVADERPLAHKAEPAEKKEPVPEEEPTPGIQIEKEDRTNPEIESDKKHHTPQEQPQKKEARDVVEDDSEEVHSQPEPTTPAASGQGSTNAPASNHTKAVLDLMEQKPVVGESFSARDNSVHERLAQIKDDKSIGMRMQYKPVNNIRQAIGVNEKFLFINELFSGDLNAYNEAVDQLNSCPSIHEAFELLNKLTLQYHWDGQRSADTIEKFANLVQRRFMQ